MLLIKGWLNDEFEKEPLAMEWHLGESVPPMSRVVSFQADGDELSLFIDAMHISQNGRFGIAHSKLRGFFRTTVVLCPYCGHTYIDPLDSEKHGYEICKPPEKIYIPSAHPKD